MYSLKYKVIMLAVTVASLVTVGFTAGIASADCAPNPAQKHYCCGQQDLGVQTAINIGCRSQGNPITDMLFAVVRLLSNGVGIVIVGSLIVGGIQYSASAGDPQAAAKAIARVRATLVALAIFIFAYPLLNYLIPSGFFK